jgi:hypothetical protein
MVRDICVGIFLTIAGLAMTVLAPLLLFAPLGPVLATERLPGSDDIYVDRRALPGWLWWFQTPDERLPGGLYEPAVRLWLSWFGYRVCSVLWLVRNAGYGLAWSFGRPASGYLDAIEGQVVEADGLWRWKKTTGIVSWQAGWKVHRKDFDATAESGPYWAVPFVSVRLKANS